MHFGDKWQPFIHHIQGTGKDRRITISLSDTLLHLDVEKSALNLGGFRYCADFYRSLLSVGLQKISGTAQRQIFSTIEKMVFEAISQEVNFACVRKLLRCALLSLENGQHNRIGSMRLWKKNHENINNLLCRLDKYEIKQRVADGKPVLLDLPKECLYNIISRLSNPTDIANFGQTCGYLHVICEDSFLWKQLCFHHFSEKQISSCITGDVDLCDTDWKYTFYLCKGRYRLTVREVYGDEIVLCDNCRKLYWRLHGHPCSNPDMSSSKTSISPQEMVAMLRL